MSNSELTETIAAWRSLRDDIKDREKIFKESMAEDKATLEALEGMVLTQLRSLKIRSANVEGEGTAFISKKLSSKVEDPEAFFAFVLESGRTELLFARAADKAVEEYIEQAKVPPPGVKIETTERLNFRTKQ